MLGLSFRTDSRAVPRVCDWDPQPRATQKVSVCVLSGGGGRGGGRDRARVWYPMGHGQGRSLGSPWSRWEPCQEGDLHVEGSALLGLCLGMALHTTAVSRHQGGAQVPESL